jgi:uncharacterized protein YidB (DUF937 family)
MGILEDLLASAMSGAGGTQDRGGLGGMGGMGGPAAGRSAPTQAGGGMGSVMMALLPVVLSMLASRGGGASQGGMGGGGGLGDILGQVLGGGAQRGGGGGMGDILGQVLGGGAAQSGTGGMGDMGGMGGLGGLLEQLQRAGYGDQARSWVGTGQNAPISPEALEQVFGHDGMAAIARQAGVSEADAARGLSELLPEVVDRVTPGGDVPDLDALTASVSDLSRRLGLG